jgi:hypothetical protein
LSDVLQLHSVVAGRIVRRDPSSSYNYSLDSLLVSSTFHPLTVALQLTVITLSLGILAGKMEEVMMAFGLSQSLSLSLFAS